MQVKMGKPVQPFHLYVSAPGGCGKSFLVKTIVNESHKLLCDPTHPQDVTCLVTALTGSASVAINGFTLHSVFKLPRHMKAYYKPLYVHNLLISKYWSLMKYQWLTED